MGQDDKMEVESVEIIVRSSSAIATLSEGLPALITDEGDQATTRFIEFFTAQIPNANTRSAYFRATTAFLAWAEAADLPNLAAIGPVHVSAYRELLGRHYAPCRR